MKILTVLAVVLGTPAWLAGATQSPTDRTAPTPVAPAACCRSEPAAPPLSSRSIYQLETAWTDDAGAPFTLDRLRGQPAVIAMFFASCEYACPILVSDIKRLRDLLPPAERAQTRFVLVSFDDVRDTPAALRSYRTRAQLDDGWILLHGGSDEVRELALVLGLKYKRDARGQFSHTNLITVLNSEGEVAHQRTGLQGEVATAARVVTVAR